MAGTAPTLDSLERRLRKIMSAPTTHVVRYIHPENAGNAEWEEGCPLLVISLDSFWNGELQTLLHELTHYALRLDRAWGGLEEPMVLGIEKAITQMVMNSRARGKWWRNALYDKLAKEGK